MINLTINGKAITAPDGATLLDAATQGGFDIPTLCYLKDVHKFGACRICVVEVEGMRNLQASCMVPAGEGMVVHTNSARVRSARRDLYNLMISNHPKDCLNCERSQDCELQELGNRLGVTQTRFAEDETEEERHDFSSPSIRRVSEKCILCRRCITICNEIQGVGALNAQHRGFATTISPAMELPLASSNCTNCGQCTVVCPVAALQEADATGQVWEALQNPAKRVVVQVAPAIRAAIGEEFGYEPGTRTTGKMVSALRELGFNDVFDTNFTADLTIMEEGTEFLGRVTAALAPGHAERGHGVSPVLPMITSCSPGWIKFVEHTYPDHLAHLSSCKSPHAMLGALTKSFYAKRIQVDPKDIYVVSIMPCTAKKFEIGRPELSNDGLPNVDAVLTTRELARMIRADGIDFRAQPDGQFDNPLGLSTGAADIFGVTGGVMEAALRTVYELVTGRELPFEGLHVQPIVGLDRVKTADMTIENPKPEYAFLNGVTVKVAVTSGFKGARQLMDQIANGTSPYHFIEIMGCPGGCIAGGGQPRPTTQEIREKRMSAIYSEDESKKLRKSHENPDVAALYKDFLGEANGHMSHELLHTHYTPRGKYNERMVLEE
ncbi:MAG: NADH-dependent [FeFe] hydrogenase, group A6 [Clostridia bacterium]|nr:NADH-dependent [FeFe] hydrogenase, group A6 [Clostridia bacterium]